MFEFFMMFFFKQRTDYEIEYGLVGAEMYIRDRFSVADYLGGIDWAGHEQSRGWYAVFKSRPSFRPLPTERMVTIQPPSPYAPLEGSGSTRLVIVLAHIPIRPRRPSYGA